MIKKDILRTYSILKGSKLRRIIGCYRSPGVHAIVIFCFGQWLKKKNISVRVFLESLYLVLYHRIRSKWGIEIPRTAVLGEGFYIGHSGGIILSPSVKFGKNANISQQVMVGVGGQGKNRGVPAFGDNVYIAPDAKIFGKIKIGTNVKIGANAVVYKDIPNNSIVVLDPGFKIL